MTRKRVLAISSPGGHWIQLNKLCNPLEQDFDITYITAGNQYKSSQNSGGKIYHVADASADNKFKLIPLAFQLLMLFIKVRPNVILSTGAAPGAIAFMLAKFLPIKTIWVDSIANVSQLSRSGRLVAKHADQVLTQWEPLSDNQAILYRGSIL